MKGLISSIKSKRSAKKNKVDIKTSPKASFQSIDETALGLVWLFMYVWLILPYFGTD